MVTLDDLAEKYEEIVDRENLSYAYATLIDDLYYSLLENEQLKETQGRANALQAKLDKAEEILQDAGSKTHRSKMLYDWYCENGNDVGGYEVLEEIKDA